MSEEHDNRTPTSPPTESPAPEKAAESPQPEKAVAPAKKKDLLIIKDLLEDGKIKPIIDKTFSMEQASEAHRYIEEGKKKGSVLLTMKKERQ